MLSINFYSADGIKNDSVDLSEEFYAWLAHSQAQHKFPELISATRIEPQLIYDQDKLVAAVIEVKTFQEFLSFVNRCKFCLCHTCTENAVE